MMKFTFFMPTKVLFGSGKIKSLHKEIMPGKKALLVTSNGSSAKKYGYIDKVVNELKQSNCEYVLFNEIEPNPLKDSVMKGAKKAKDNNCDFIVALGGGSVMDASKAIAIMSTNDGDLWDYIKSGTGKNLKPKNRSLPLICITTTAGTGSEADDGGVITNPETNEKTAIIGHDLFPVISVVDPDFMITVPKKETAYQGFDALFHCIEGYLSRGGNAACDMLSIDSIKKIHKYLPIAINEPDNIDARSAVAYGNTMAGIILSIGGVTSQHSLEHSLSAYHQDLPHGAGLIMLSLAYFSKWLELGSNDNFIKERFIDLAQALGNPNASKPEDFIIALKEFQKSCLVDDLKMSDYGIKQDEFENMAHNAKDCMGMLFNVDRVDLSIDDCIDIYKNSYK